MQNKLKEILKSFGKVILMECHNISYYPMYWFCMFMLPLFVIFFFTHIMDRGLPTNMPIGVVDLDNSTTSRSLLRNLDSYQQSEIVARYPNVTEARKAMQRNEIYGFMFIPYDMEEDLISSRQPKISFYYNNSILLAGSLIYKEMRAISTLGSASVSSAKMRAKGIPDKQIKAILQPIVIDSHAVDNPWLNYNIALSTTIIPATIALFIFLMTAYTIGAELKFGRSKDWMAKANNSIILAITGKMLPQTICWSLIIWAYQYTLFGHLGFPHNCSFGFIMFAGFVLVIACQGFSIFIFGLLPSLRMSMSICALWAVLSFSISGFTFPVTTMDYPLQILSWMFPMRSYFMIYQMNMLHGFPLFYSWQYFTALAVFIFLPLLVLKHIKTVLNEYEYIS